MTRRPAWAVLLMAWGAAWAGAPRVKLTYMFWGGEEERSIRTALVEEFNRSQDRITITPIHAPDDYDRKLKTMMGAGMAPDIFHLSDSEVAKWARKGVLMDLLPFYQHDPEASLDDFVPQEVQKRMIDGKFYGISDATETMVVFFGTELFRRWNVPLPPTDHLWTWDEFVHTARQLTKDTDGDGRIDQWGCYVPVWDGSIDPILWSLGGEHYSDDFTQLYPNRDLAVQAFQTIMDLVLVHKVMPPRSELVAMGQSASHLLETGRLAMLVTGQWYLINLAQANFPFDVAPFPAVKEPSNILISSNFSIYAGTKHPQEAWEAYKWLSGERGQILLSSSGIVMPTSRRLLFTEEGRALWQKPGIHPPHHTWACVQPILYARYTKPFPGGDQLYFDVQRTFYEDLFLAKTREEVAHIVLRMCDASDAFLRAYAQAQAPPLGSVDRLLAGLGRFLRRKALVAALLAGVLAVAVAGLSGWGRRRGLAGREAATGLLFVLPSVVGLLVLSLGPVLFSLAISLTEWDIVTMPRYVGLGQYRTALRDPLVAKSLWVTCYYTVVNVPLTTAAGLLLALLLNTRVRGMRVFRTLFYLPAVVPSVASAVLWVWVFNPEYGLLNSLIKALNWTMDALCGGVGLPAPRFNDHLEWLHDPRLVMPSLWLMGLWGAGGAMVVYLAGLQGIPRHLYECAELDGAGWWAKFRHVTVPMISPVIFFNLIMSTIGSFQVFVAGYLMTGGGPKDSTLFYVLYLYRNAFHYLKMGYASALAWVLFVVIVSMTLLLFRVVGRRVYYEA